MKVFDPVALGAGVLELGFGHAHRRLGLAHRGFQVAALEPCQERPLPHPLAFDHRHALDAAQDLGARRHPAQRLEGAGGAAHERQRLEGRRGQLDGDRLGAGRCRGFLFQGRRIAAAAGDDGARQSQYGETARDG